MFSLPMSHARRKTPATTRLICIVAAFAYFVFLGAALGAPAPKPAPPPGKDPGASPLGRLTVERKSNSSFAVSSNDVLPIYFSFSFYSVEPGPEQIAATSTLIASCFEKFHTTNVTLEGLVGSDGKPLSTSGLGALLAVGSMADPKSRLQVAFGDFHGAFNNTGAYGFNGAELSKGDDKRTIILICPESLVKNPSKKVLIDFAGLGLTDDAMAHIRDAKKVAVLTCDPGGKCNYFGEGVDPTPAAPPASAPASRPIPHAATQPPDVASRYLVKIDLIDPGATGTIKVAFVGDEIGNKLEIGGTGAKVGDLAFGGPCELTVANDKTLLAATEGITATDARGKVWHSAKVQMGGKEVIAFFPEEKESAPRKPAAEAAAALDMAKLYIANGRADIAREKLNTIISTCPGTPEAEEAKALLVKLK